MLSLSSKIAQRSDQRVWMSQYLWNTVREGMCDTRKCDVNNNGNGKHVCVQIPFIQSASTAFSQAACMESSISWKWPIILRYLITEFEMVFGGKTIQCRNYEKIKSKCKGICYTCRMLLIKQVDLGAKRWNMTDTIGKIKKIRWKNTRTSTISKTTYHGYFQCCLLWGKLHKSGTYKRDSAVQYARAERIVLIS